MRNNTPRERERDTLTELTDGDKRVIIMLTMMVVVAAMRRGKVRLAR